MASKDLVPANGKLANREERLRALEALNTAAETAKSLEDLNRIRIEGQVASEALKKLRAHSDETRLAAKASVKAGRKLGCLLLTLSASPGRKGLPLGARPLPSPRRQALDEIGLSENVARWLVRIADIPDPEFQRYIQDTSVIPSITGACVDAQIKRRRNGGGSVSRLNKRLKIKVPRNPSIAEAHSLVIRALGHLSAGASLPIEQSTDIRRALQEARAHLYAAEDALRPHRDGYTTDGRRSA